MKVVAIDNMQYEKLDCVKIFDKFYKKGDINTKDSGHAYKIGGRWKTHAEWDHYHNRYVDPAKEALLFGFVTAKEKGFFSTKASQVIHNGEYYMSKYIFLDQGFIPDVKGDIVSLNDTFHSNGGKTLCFLSDTSVAKKAPGSFNLPKVIYNKIGTGLTYSLADITRDSTKKMINDSYLNGLTHKPIYDKLSKLIPYSIGIEYETSHGFLPEELCLKAGLVPLKDGSISSHEYVSIPYKGKYLVDSIVRSALYLTNYAKSDHSCSLHVHFGSLPKDRMFILSLYKLWYELEEEMSSLNIVNKRNFKFILSKKSPEKDHCQPLPDLNFPRVMTPDKVSEMYSKMISLINNGQKPNQEFNVKNKNHIYAGQQKWNITGRYFSLNFLNYLYGKSGTVEFRLHKGTVNPYKTLNYILILNAIIQYSQKHQKEIFDPYTRPCLKGVLYHTYGNTPLFNYLYDYVSERKNEYFEEYVKNSNNKNSNYLYHSNDFLEDNIYTFKTQDYDVLNEPNWLTTLGAFEKPLDIGPEERFPFVPVTGNTENMKEENFTMSIKYLFSPLVEQILKPYIQFNELALDLVVASKMYGNKFIFTQHSSNNIKHLTNGCPVGFKHDVILVKECCFTLNANYLDYVYNTDVLFKSAPLFGIITNSLDIHDFTFEQIHKITSHFELSNIELSYITAAIKIMQDRYTFGGNETYDLLGNDVSKAAYNLINKYFNYENLELISDFNIQMDEYYEEGEIDDNYLPEKIKIPFLNIDNLDDISFLSEYVEKMMCSSSNKFPGFANPTYYCYDSEGKVYTALHSVHPQVNLTPFSKFITDVNRDKFSYENEIYGKVEFKVQEVKAKVNWKYIEENHDKIFANNAEDMFILGNELNKIELKEEENI